MQLFFKKLVLTFIIALVVFSLPLASEALNIGQNYSDNIADTAGYQTTEVQGTGYLDTTVGKAIAIIMGFVGILFFIIILVSGFQWMTAGGNDDKAKQAKDRVVSATVGLLIVLSAYTITYFIYNTIQKSSTGDTGPAWFENEGGLDCAYNSDCTDSPDGPHCAWYDTYSFCTECLEDVDCSGQTPNCYKLRIPPYIGPVISHWCVQCETAQDCGWPNSGNICIDTVCNVAECTHDIHCGNIDIFYCNEGVCTDLDNEV